MDPTRNLREKRFQAGEARGGSIKILNVWEARGGSIKSLNVWEARGGSIKKNIRLRRW